MAYTNADVDSILTETQRNILKSEISSDIFYSDMIARLEWADVKSFDNILPYKYSLCFERFKKKWEPILIADKLEKIPSDHGEFSALVFARDDYKDKKTLDDEKAASLSLLAKAER